MPALLIVLALTFAAVLLASGWFEPYGLLHDELYYWVGAKRLELGYVDHPPLAPWVLALGTALFGDGPLVFGLIPALCGAGTVLLAGRMAQRLGAGGFGQTLAGLCVAVTPFNLVIFSFYSVNAFEVLLWTTTTFWLLELIRTGNERLWLGIGAIAGIGLLNKHTFALLAFGIAAGLVATPLRNQLRRRWLWLGVATALLLAMPNVLWNALNDWPSLVFYRSRPAIDLPATLLEALELQVVGANPANVLIWIPGALFLFSSRKAPSYRPLAIVFFALFLVILLSGQRRADRIAGIYPIVLAAGAACWDRWRGRGYRLVRIALITVVSSLGALMATVTLPIMSPESVGRAFEAFGESPEIEISDVGQPIPIYLAGRLEWERFAHEVLDAWEALDPTEQERAVVLAPHWLYASVVQYYGIRRDLPPVVSPHNAYWFWREDAAGRDVVLAVAISSDVLARYFATTRELGVFRCEYCTSYRTELPIVLGADPVRPLEELLLDWRHFGIEPVPQLRP
jgi:MFS family permease